MVVWNFQLSTQKHHANIRYYSDAFCLIMEPVMSRVSCPIGLATRVCEYASVVISGDHSAKVLQSDRDPSATAVVLQRLRLLASRLCRFVYW